MRVFNKSNRLFQLESGTGRILVAPRKLLEIPDEFLNDITYKMAVKAGDIEEMSAETMTANAELAQTVVDNGTEKKPEAVNHPDGLEEMEARRKASVASGRKTRKPRAN